MLLIDTGPIVAILDHKDQLHARGAAALRTVGSRFTTTEACVTEAVYHLWDAGGWPATSTLQSMIDSGAIEIVGSPVGRIQRAFTFMQRFRDIPCDFADASLLVAAEDTGVRRIFTFDKHFYAYRLTNGDHLEVIP